MIKTLDDINKEFELLLKELPKDFNKEKVSEAYEFAKLAHLDQKRDTGEPYISHPLEVAKIVLSFGLDESSIIAAFLHDVVEDTKIDLLTIKREFGEEVEVIVDGLSKIHIFGENKEDRNIEALRKILLASAKDIRILVIKLCDRLHNMRTLEELPEAKRERVARETLLIYVPIAQKIGISSLKWELEDLALKYRNPEMYQFIKNKLGLKRVERESIVQKAVGEIKEVLDLHGYKNNITALGRPKNFYSIYKKIKKKAKSFDDIYDLYAVRIVAKSIGDCYTILGILHENFQAYPNRLKDYITNPKLNGYQSIHTVIFSRAIRTAVEIQIRTEDMHKLAEFGVAAHWKYKDVKEDKKFEKKISWLREVLQWEKEHKDSQEFLKLLKFDFFEDEIFVVTPKNDVINLKEGATALDFAYAVHTDIGNKAVRVKVNGFVTSLDKILKSGDLVEVITDNKAKPSEKWLKFVQTSKAKIKIRDALNLKFAKRRDDEEERITFEMLKEKMTRVSSYKKVRKAGCCDFEYGDQIVGVLSKDKKELVVHNASCDNAKYAITTKIPIRWIEESEKEVKLNLMISDRFGVLMDILNVFSEFNVAVSKLNTKVHKDGTVKMEISLIDGPYIDKLVNSLEDLDSVDKVDISRGLFW